MLAMRCVAAPVNIGSSTLVTSPVVWAMGEGPNWTSASV